MWKRFYGRWTCDEAKLVINYQIIESNYKGGESLIKEFTQFINVPISTAKETSQWIYVFILGFISYIMYLTFSVLIP